MARAIFITSLCSIIAIFVLCVPSLINKKYRIFPPPSIKTWQYYLFWTLFRVFIIGLIIVSILDFDSYKNGSSSVLGLLLLISGIGAAFYFSFFTLGKTNSFGGKSGLRKNGIYRWSRNPIYVVTIVGMLGWGLFVNSIFTWVLLCLWASIYVLAPFIEEPWLLEKYGSEYIKYKDQVPRFFKFLKWPI